jgi:hypothetical protein
MKIAAACPIHHVMAVEPDGRIAVRLDPGG